MVQELSIVSYKRIREIDEFYEDRPNKRKCRVTKNAETKQVRMLHETFNSLSDFNICTDCYLY